MQHDDQNTKDDIRKDERKKVVWPAEITLESDQKYPCSILDVSFAGTLIECDAPLQENEEILLTIAELGDFAGKVKWSKNDSTGLLLMAGPDLLLKKFAETSGDTVSTHPIKPE